MISLICVGDINLKFRDNLIFEKEIVEIFKKGNLKFGNLETVVSELGGIPESKAFNFKVKIEKLKLLKELEFDVLNIANNHTLDFGEELKKDTKKNILEENIKVIGENINNNYDIEIFKVKEKNIAFLGIDITEIKDKVKILETIREVKSKVDYLIFSIHWGIELCYSPTINQRKLAYQLIDNGVDIILGHHPHVIQGIEKYKKGIILYSLGNFQFKLEEKIIDLNQYTNIFKLKITEEKIEVETYPVFIQEDGNPTVKLNEKQKIRHKEIQEKCQEYIENLNYFNILKEMSNYPMKQHLIAWKKRKQKKEKNYYLKKIRWFISPKNFVVFFLYLIREIFIGVKNGDN